MCFFQNFSFKKYEINVFKEKILFKLAHALLFKTFLRIAYLGICTYGSIPLNP